MNILAISEWILTVWWALCIILLIFVLFMMLSSIMKIKDMINDVYYRYEFIKTKIYEPVMIINAIIKKFTNKK